MILQSEEEIPARLERDVMTKLMFRGRLEAGVSSDWGTEPSSISTGVYAARTLIANDRCVDVPVRVVNVQPTSVRIRAGTIISTLQPVSVVDNKRAKSNDIAELNGAETDVKSVVIEEEEAQSS